jgi:hypothetical protein
MGQTMREPDYEMIRKAWIDIGTQREIDPAWILRAIEFRGKSFDNFIDETRKKAAREAVNAERLRILGLLENGWAMNQIWMGQVDE